MINKAWCLVFSILLVFVLGTASSFAAQDKTGPPTLYPAPTITPGVTNPAITQQNIATTICNPQWTTKSIRPAASYTTKLKRQQIRQYGFLDKNVSHYEEDHFISLELGGHPSDPRNLWPESYNTTVNGKVVGAKQKDRVEDALHRKVCAGTLTLQAAQRAIQEDWYAIYLQLPHITEKR